MGDAAGVSDGVDGEMALMVLLWRQHGWEMVLLGDAAGVSDGVDGEMALILMWRWR